MLTIWGDCDFRSGFGSPGRMLLKWAPIKMAIGVVMHDFFMFSVFLITFQNYSDSRQGLWISDSDCYKSNRARQLSLNDYSLHVRL